MIFVWLLLIAWELRTSVFNIAHPVLVPCPENVFDTFREQWREMLLNVAYARTGAPLHRALCAAYSV